MAISASTLLGLAMLGSAGPAGATTARSTNSSDPIYFVHGFERDASNDCNSTWGTAKSTLRSFGMTGTFITVGYYAGDTHCTRKIKNGTTDTRIQELARVLAWDIYNHYSKHGKYVDVLAHSMGGLIADGALVGVIRYGGNGSWPPYLRVRNAVTLSTPFNGATRLVNICAITHEQCSDMRAGSGYLRWLAAYQNPQGKGGTDWTLEGAYSDTTVASSSAIGTKAKHKVQYTGRQGISHSNITHKNTGNNWQVKYTNNSGSSWTTSSSALSPVMWAAWALWATSN